MHESLKMAISMHLTCMFNDRLLPYGHHVGENKPAGMQVQRPWDEPSGAPDAARVALTCGKVGQAMIQPLIMHNA